MAASIHASDYFACSRAAEYCEQHVCLCWCISLSTSRSPQLHVHSSPASAARMLILCGILVVVAVLSGDYGSDVDTVGWASGRASGL